MRAGVQFPPAVVRQHAAAVGEFADQMAVARSAVHEVTMDAQAYGHLCQFLPGILAPVFGIAVEVLNDAVDALSETALKLRAAGGSIEAVDIYSARRLSESHRE